ncbi:unnamed protein product, partial [Laminaria digitata]
CGAILGATTVGSHSHLSSVTADGESLGDGNGGLVASSEGKAGGGQACLTPPIPINWKGVLPGFGGAAAAALGQVADQQHHQHHHPAAPGADPAAGGSGGGVGVGGVGAALAMPGVLGTHVKGGAFAS